MKDLVITLPDVPENWSNTRYHWAELSRRKANWRQIAFFASQHVRNLAGWKPVAETDSRRRIEITLHKCAPLFDDDGAMAAVKPVIDGLRRSVVYDDRPRYAAIPGVTQVRVAHRNQQKTVVRVVEESVAESSAPGDSLPTPP